MCQKGPTTELNGSRSILATVSKHQCDTGSQNPTFVYRKWLARSVLVVFVCTVAASGEAALSQAIYDLHESERSDKVTGGSIERAEFEPGEPDIRVTLNVPSFRLTLWQNGKEVASYFVGIGLKDYPIYIGEREASEIIWNPAWIPPSSDWVNKKKGVRPGEIIKASDPRNPLGKMKIPLGDRYLIHEAANRTDLGNLVSHGCVRMLRVNLYDLSEKILAARSASISRKRIAAAKRSSRMLVVTLDEPVPVDINYDTLVVEDRLLHIYPDVYTRRMNEPSRLREELQSSGVDVSQLDEMTIKKMLSKVGRQRQFVVETSSIEQGRALEDGRVLPVIAKKDQTAGVVSRSRRQVQ